MKILCVCLGNICRSPTAEAVFKNKLKEKGLNNKIFVDSAGTSSWHEGEPPDSRSRHHALQRGYSMEEQKSRQVREEDFIEYDLILAMDQKNQFDLEQMVKSQEQKDKIKLVTDFCVLHDRNKVKGVPDPYHKGDEGFEFVLDLLEDACEQIISNCKITEKEK